MRCSRPFAQAGFTLIEITLVLVLLGILGAVAIPKYFDLHDQSQEKACLARRDALRGELLSQWAEDLLKASNSLPKKGDPESTREYFQGLLEKSENKSCPKSKSQYTITIGSDPNDVLIFDQDGITLGIHCDHKEFENNGSDDSGNGENSNNKQSNISFISENIAKFQEAIKLAEQANDKLLNGAIDSGAHDRNDPFGSWASKYLDYLADAFGWERSALDVPERLDELGIVSWQINTKTNEFYWAPFKIDNLIGQSVPIIGCNKDGKYSIYETKIGQNYTNKNSSNDLTDRKYFKAFGGSHTSIGSYDTLEDAIKAYKNLENKYNNIPWEEIHKIYP